MYKLGAQTPFIGTNAERVAIPDLTNHRGRLFLETDTEIAFMCDGATWYLTTHIALIKALYLSGGDGTFSFTNIPTAATFTHLMLIGNLQSDAAAEFDSAAIRLNNDSGVDAYAWKGILQFGDGNASFGSADVSDSAIFAGDIDADNGPSGMSSWTMWIPNYAKTTKYHYVYGMSVTMGDLSETDDIGISHFAGSWDTLAAINRIDAFPFAGTNFLQYGQLSLYGLK